MTELLFIEDETLLSHEIKNWLALEGCEVMDATDGVLDIQHKRQMAAFKEALVTEHEKLCLQAKLVAMFLHDFRNQLAVILTSTSLMRKYADRLTEQRRLDHLNSIETSVRLLEEMLDDMLLVAQIETDKITLKTEPLTVAQFFQDIVQEFQTVCGETHRLNFKSNFTESIASDRRLLRQIAANLISNAIKYSPPETEIHIALDKHDEYYVLSVKDYGVGIPDTDLKHLFDAFQRGSNVEKIAGTGLGLAVVKHATDLLRGSIKVESQVGVGTAIMVTLPLLIPE